MCVELKKLSMLNWQKRGLIADLLDGTEPPELKEVLQHERYSYEIMAHLSKAMKFRSAFYEPGKNKLSMLLNVMLPENLEFLGFWKREKKKLLRGSGEELIPEMCGVMLGST